MGKKSIAPATALETLSPLVLQYKYHAPKKIADAVQNKIQNL
jgi:hypothetical protein